jgi:hypothetical protein
MVLVPVPKEQPGTQLAGCQKVTCGLSQWKGLNIGCTTPPSCCWVSPVGDCFLSHFPVARCSASALPRPVWFHVTLYSSTGTVEHLLHGGVWRFDVLRRFGRHRSGCRQVETSEVLWATGPPLPGFLRGVPGVHPARPASK